MDAVRVTDGTSVIIKLIHKPSHPHEVEIGQYLSMDAFRADAHNHSVPIQEVLAVPDDEECVLAIMPLLRKFDDPPFGTLGEAAGCVKQAFEASTDTVVKPLPRTLQTSCRVSSLCITRTWLIGLSC
jgi:hypothetical protein